ncbi:MAG: peptidoglycan-binding domain-containing protein [Candidatus Absconditabacteria bacterium]|nr:peptidoglycan-binding domain-containing protein [Candidatus Absconditabacteria bacterium]
MSEKITDIHESVNKKDWVKNKIAEVYADSNKDLQTLKNSIINTSNADEIMEQKFTMDHVKNVLQDTVDFISKEGHTEAFEKQGAGLTLSLQIALTKLGFKPGVIDGIYMKGSDQTEGRAVTTKAEKEKIYSRSNTRKAVKDFQEQWNKNNPNNKLVEDGRAGKETLTKILEKLNQQPIITGIDLNPKVKLADKLKESEKLLAEIGAQYILPKGDRTAEKIDKTLTTPSKVILKSNIGGKTVEIEFDETDEDLSGFNPNFRLDFGLKTRYYNPTLISGKDSFDLQERILGKGPTAKTIITLIPKKEETKPVKKTEKSDKPVVIPTPPEKEETETEGLTGNELNAEVYNYEDLKGKLQGMNGEKITALGELQSLQESTKTKLFCFESENQKTIEEMLAPVIIATGDMPYSSVNYMITSQDKRDSGCVSYSIKDIAETLNTILKGVENNSELKDIDMQNFKKFCKYLLEKEIIVFDATQKKYIDKAGGEEFINVLFAKKLENTDGAEISIAKDGQTIVEHMDVNEANHELRHAEFESKIKNNSEYYTLWKNYFYKPENLEKVKQFLKVIYQSNDIPYTWHFDNDGSTSQKRMDFIESLDSNSLKTKIKTTAYPTGNTPESNLLNEFWAYTHDGLQNSSYPQPNDVNDIDLKQFPWEEGYVAPQNDGIETGNQEILNTINSKYDITGNNNNINLDTTEKLTNGDILVKGKIGEKQLDIIFNSDYSNPRLQINQKQYNIYEIPTIDPNKTKIVVVHNSEEIVENFLSYRDNLVISGREPITGGKFDFSDSEKISIVFKDGDNEIKISFDNEANLMTQEVSIGSDKYKVSINNNKINLEKVIEETVNNNVSNNINSILEGHKAPLNVEYENNKYNYEKRTLEILEEKFIENKNKFGNNQKFSDFEKLINDKINEIKTTLNNYKTNPSTIAIGTPEKNRMDASLRVDGMIRDFLNKSGLQSGQSSMTDIINEL